MCRAFKKRSTGQSKISGWDSSYYYDESSSSAADAQRPPNIVSCKQEIEGGVVDQSLQSFVQLPQLESPVPPPKRACTNIFDHHLSSTKKVTDWRDLDKFVASQLSQGDGLHVGPGFEALNSDSDLGLLLLQTSRQEDEDLNHLSTSDPDNIGICIFNK